ncbi:hypothetical protein [Nocardia wallacei]|uniref:hypothetical protein n=1 Tax=Nocardia wallacei TaxID=480035 RepID=UPI0024589109|nr:hypothetical protein [Nocardia wallacei]
MSECSKRRSRYGIADGGERRRGPARNTACPSCAWPSPALISSHGSVRYLRCVCGRWLVVDGGAVVAAAGSSQFAEPPTGPADTATFQARGR